MNKKFNASKTKKVVVNSLIGLSVANTVLLTPIGVGKVVELTQQVEQQNVEISNVKKELGKKELHIQEISNKNQELSDTIESKEKELEEVTSKKNELESKNSVLQKKVNDLSSKQTVSRGSNTSSRSSNPTGKKITMEATAYHEGEPGNAGGRTATGIKAQTFKTIAVDPRVIPLHTKVYVEFPRQPHRNGYYYAHDTGGAIKGNIIDVFVGGHNEMYNFGRQTVNVYI